MASREYGYGLATIVSDRDDAALQVSSALSNDRANMTMLSIVKGRSSNMDVLLNTGSCRRHTQLKIIITQRKIGVHYNECITEAMVGARQDSQPSKTMYYNQY
jgi:hypothetical protein